MSDLKKNVFDFWIIFSTLKCTFSDQYELSFCVPQGSVLGSKVNTLRLCYAIYIGSRCNCGWIIKFYFILKTHFIRMRRLTITVKSSSKCMLDVLKFRTKWYGARSFSYTAEWFMWWRGLTLLAKLKKGKRDWKIFWYYIKLLLLPSYNLSHTKCVYYICITKRFELTQGKTL